MDTTRHCRVLHRSLSSTWPMEFGSVLTLYTASEACKPLPSTATSCSTSMQACSRGAQSY